MTVVENQGIIGLIGLFYNKNIFALNLESLPLNGVLRQKQLNKKHTANLIETILNFILLNYLLRKLYIIDNEILIMSKT